MTRKSISIVGISGCLVGCFLLGLNTPAANFCAGLVFATLVFAFGLLVSSVIWKAASKTHKDTEASVKAHLDEVHSRIDYDTPDDVK